MAEVCVVFDHGFEEIETITLIDILRRADLHVQALGVSQTSLQGAHGLWLQTDGILKDHTQKIWDAVVLPGGGRNAQSLCADGLTQTFLKEQARNARTLLAAICAAPTALAKAGLLAGRRATCYPGMEGQMADAQIVPLQPVVEDGRIITSRGPATALPFALKLVERLAGPSVREAVAKQLLAA